jgi:3-oxoacyl-[acyl-carrier protein] reductase
MDIPTRLKGKAAIVTGAGSGYGAGTARRFAAEGARVAILDLNFENAQKVASEINAKAPASAIAIKCDVGSNESVKQAVEDVLRQFGGFEIIVNNAALTQKPKRVAKATETEIDQLFAVNLKSLYYMAVHAFPVLRQRGGGSVINISSVGALRPRGGMHWYNATKAAVITLTMSMAAELAADKIRVNAIGPSVGRTPMGHSMFDGDSNAALDKMVATSPLGRLCEPNDIAAAAAFLASDDASFITGIFLPVDGGRLVG